MIRKLRRLRVPVCFYTCCSLCAILLFVSFNEDVKNLLQHSGSSGGGGTSGSQSGFPASFSSFSSVANPRTSISSSTGNNNNINSNSINNNNGGRPLISSISSGAAESSSSDVTVHAADEELLQHADAEGERKQQQPEDSDVIKKYIDDNFVGRHEPKSEGSQQQQQQKQKREKKEQQQNTNVISNLVKLAQQASNNPSVFNNINSLTGDETAGLGGGAGGGDEFSGVFMETQGTTTDSELSYPGGDAANQVRKRERQWFMSGGDYFPTPPGGLASIFYPSASWLASKPTNNLDYANLWYDNAIGSDRVIEQLMFAIDDPINYANISWGFEGPTATTVRPSASLLTNEPGGGLKGAAAEDDNEREDNELGPPAPVVAQEEDPAPVAPVAGNSRGPGGGISSSISFSSASSSSQYMVAAPSGVGRRPSGSSSMAVGAGPPGSISTLRDPRLGKIKTILLYYGLGMSWGSHITNGRQVFLQQKCPVNACRLTGNRAQLSKADVVVFKDVFMHPKVRRPPDQLWVMYMLECPLNTQNFLEKNAFNLTATYRHDSDIVTPYEKWVYFEDTVRSLPQAINYAEGKTKKVAWFVSNCVAKNQRLEYARELAKYIEVDIYGACGSHTCSRANAKQCFEMLSRNYKFYLAFENSNCRDYISEKFFVNGLGNNVLPIVMGAHPDDYKRVAPDRSYIHVDDFSSPKELAQYLHELDTNDDLYNEYFKWKGTGEFINTHFFCRLCAMAHYSVRSPKRQSHYEDFNRWWRGPHVCTRQSWRSAPDIFAQENYGTIISPNKN